MQQMTPTTDIQAKPAEGDRAVVHPQLGAGRLLRTYMGGFEWEVQFASGRRFRLPAREFEDSSTAAWQQHAPSLVPPAAPRAATLEIDQFRARQTLEALRLGVVPVRDVETLTIGLEAERVSLERALARSRERGGDVQAVIGDYGFGKSHFVELAARRALRENFIVAAASLDLVEAPPAKAFEIYRALVRSIRYPDEDGSERGLRPLVRRALEHPGVVAAFVERSPVPLHCPISAALRALQDCADQGAYDDIMAWLAGQIKPTPDLRRCLKRPPSLYAAGEVGRLYSYLLSGLSVLATLCGYSGLAILIDESEHYSLLRATQRGRADAFFKALIYGALGSGSRVDPTAIPEHVRVSYPTTFATNPHLFFLFALTESENRMPVDAWLAPAQIVRLDDRFIERDIAAFGSTLLQYHGLAYGYTPDVERFGALLTTAPALLSALLGQHRVNLREVIRLSVTLYDLLYLHRDYTPAALLNELRRGVGAGLP